MLRTNEIAENLAKLDDNEMEANRGGASNDAKANVAVSFAAKVMCQRGRVSDDDLRALRAADYDVAQVIEIALHVALNTWTNYINLIAETDIDFPVVEARKAA